MSDIIKKYKKSIAVGGSTVSIIGVLLFFLWDLGVSKQNVIDLPETIRRTNAMYDERIKVAGQLDRVTKSLDSVIIVLGYTNIALEKLVEER